MNKNPKHARRQGYTPSKKYPYHVRPNGQSNGKTNYAGKTPKAGPMKDPDATCTY